MNRDGDNDVGIDDSSENVLSEWPRVVDEPGVEDDAAGAAERRGNVETWSIAAPPPDIDLEPDGEPEPASEHELESEPDDELLAAEPELLDPDSELPESKPDAESAGAIVVAPSLEHAAGDLEIPEGYAVLEGVPDGGRRAVGIVVSRFNGNVTSRLLDRALEELELAGVRRDAITIMVVPGAFELPVAATALAKTRRFACIVALGCVIRGDTPHFDYVASEAASGLQLAALETGVPVSFGLLTLDRVEQAEPRVEKGAEAVRSALEMADVFSHLRAAASR
ncbi:MAG: 6,7-dimethyl-8-ribityllumazine synthase [Actinomycetota bacterium]|nr:6,7-dimethyl-8-ribityllumazine synthase [Actinomycetota bacterium]